VLFNRGDCVRVRGYGGKEAVLRVWEERDRGLLLCSEEGFHRMVDGGELVLVGYPMSDIAGRITASSADEETTAGTNDDGKPRVE